MPIDKPESALPVNKPEALNQPAEASNQDKLFAGLAKEAYQYNVGNAASYEALKSRLMSQGMLVPHLEIVHQRTDANKDGYLSLEEINSAQHDPKVSRGVKVFLTVLEREYKSMRDANSPGALEKFAVEAAKASGVAVMRTRDEQRGITKDDIRDWGKQQEDLRQRRHDAEVLSHLSHDSFSKLAKINQPKNGDTVVAEESEIIKLDELAHANLSGLSAKEREAIQMLRKYYDDIRQSYDHGLRDRQGIYKKDILEFIKNHGSKPADRGILDPAVRGTQKIGQAFDDGRRRAIEGVANIPDPKLPDPRKLLRP